MVVACKVSYRPNTIVYWLNKYGFWRSIMAKSTISPMWSYYHLDIGENFMAQNVCSSQPKKKKIVKLYIVIRWALSRRRQHETHKIYRMQFGLRKESKISSLVSFDSIPTFL